MLSSLSETRVQGMLIENEPLAGKTWYRLGGAARWYAKPADDGELADLLEHCRNHDLPVRLLGRGANLLVGDDGVDGVVVHLGAPAWKRVEWTLRADGRMLCRAGGGTDMGRLTLQSVRRGLSGLEGMAGIPGSVGGIIRMNAGGRWGQISDVVEEVSVLDRDGTRRTLSRDEVGFGYRRSDLGDSIVTAASLVLTPGHQAEIQARYDEIWQTKTAAQPMNAHCAGCVFKNPPGDSAGRLIEAAGLKGRRIGGAEVSSRHANFILADAKATATDVLKVIDLVRRTVAERFGVQLELELEVWNRTGDELPGRG